MRETAIDVVVISLTTARERREGMATQLSSTNWRWSFFDAHTRLAAPGLRYNEGAARRRFGRILSPQELACYSSHFAVIDRFARESAADHLVVVEDDLLIDTAFPLGGFVDFCASLGMDYVRLFGKHSAACSPIGFFYDRNLVRYLTTPAGSQAYVVNKSAARALSSHLQVVTGTVDRVLDQFWETDVPLYGIFPYPVIERYAPTQIPMLWGAADRGIREKAMLLRNRVVDKLQKTAANVVLRRSDDRIRHAARVFRQIEANSPGVLTPAAL